MFTHLLGIIMTYLFKVLNIWGTECLDNYQSVKTIFYQIFYYFTQFFILLVQCINCSIFFSQQRFYLLWKHFNSVSLYQHYRAITLFCSFSISKKC